MGWLPNHAAGCKHRLIRSGELSVGSSYGQFPSLAHTGHTASAVEREVSEILEVAMIDAQWSFVPLDLRAQRQSAV